ncbi:MAG: hypothetical protein U0670_20065 [Anaerolineae bacterium]
MNWLKRNIKKVFYLEAFINLVSIFGIFLSPESYLRGMGISEPTPLLTAAFLHFGMLLLVMTYILARVLLSGNDRALRIVLEGHLIGDFVYLYVVVMLVNAVGGVWTMTTIIGVALTIMFILVRGFYLLSHREIA